MAMTMMAMTMIAMAMMAMAMISMGMMVSRFLCSLLSRLLQRGNGSDQRFDQLCRGNPDKNRGDHNDND